jgi:hypothetical protein
LQGMVAHTGILAIPEVEMRRITVLFYIAWAKSYQEPFINKQARCDGICL